MFLALCLLLDCAFSWHGFHVFLQAFCYHSGGSYYYRYNQTFNAAHSLYLSLSLSICYNYYHLNHTLSTSADCRSDQAVRGRKFTVRPEVLQISVLSCLTPFQLYCFLPQSYIYIYSLISFRVFWICRAN